MFLVQKSRNFSSIKFLIRFFSRFFVINLQTLIQDGGNQLDLALNWKNMATSDIIDFHTEERSNLKRF